MVITGCVDVDISMKRSFNTAVGTRVLTFFSNKTAQDNEFNLYIQSKLLQHAPVTGASSGQGQYYHSRGLGEGEEQGSRYDIRSEGRKCLI